MEESIRPFFCIKARIKRELIVRYNPQRNVVAERKNRSIVETLKSMVHDLDMPMFLWAVEACCIAVYIQNKCPQKVLNVKTLEEALIGGETRRFSFQGVGEV